MEFLADLKAWRAGAETWVRVHPGTVVLIGVAVAAYLALRLAGRVLALVF